MMKAIGLYKVSPVGAGAVEKWTQWHADNIEQPFPSNCLLVDRILIPDRAALDQLVDSLARYKKWMGVHGRRLSKSNKGTWLRDFLHELYRLRDHEIQPSELKEAAEPCIDHRAFADKYVEQLVRMFERDPQMSKKQQRTNLKRALKLKEGCPDKLLVQYRKEAKKLVEKMQQKGVEQPLFGDEASGTTNKITDGKQSVEQPLVKTTKFTHPMAEKSEAINNALKFLVALVASADVGTLVEQHSELAKRHIGQFLAMVEEWVGVLEVKEND